MLDIKLIREQPDFVKQALAKKGVKPELFDLLLECDQKRRQLLVEVEALKAKRNQANDAISKAKKDGSPVEQIINDMKTVSQKIAEIDKNVVEIDCQIEEKLYNIPNLPHETVPEGFGPNSNKIIRSWGQIRGSGEKLKDHLELGSKLKWLSFDIGGKISGSAFAVFENEGARLVRALMNFMLDLHTKKHGYKEIWPPALVNRASMTGTGQLPKFEEDMYRLKDDDFFLIPTAEVPLSNIHRDEILEEKNLPIKYAAYSPCFRREAGSYGKDTKGLSRVHQFDKVELVKFVKPESSLDELELLVSDAEEVLQLLEIPYRVVLLCAGELSFSGAKCYDIEAHAPGMNRWLEVSSCSVFGDFQARRMNIKYRSSSTGKAAHIHTLNGSGVAFARTIICLLENHQQPDGSIKFPKALEPYL